MNPILLVIPYHASDFDISKKLIEWMVELGSCKPHSVLFVADSGIPQTSMRELMDLARPIFNTTRTMIVTVPKPTGGQRVWAPNVVFLNAARQVQDQFKLDFLWLEPDAIPMHTMWLDEIAEEYTQCPYRFMGSLIKQQGQEGLPPEYLNGVAVYPNDAFDVFDKIVSVKDSSQAFDIGSASAVVPKSLNTPIIQHYYGTKELPPVFVESRAPDSPKNHVTLDFINNVAVIFHRSKDGKLIDLLRAKRNTQKTTEPGMVFDAKDLQGKVTFEVKSTLEELNHGKIPQVDELKSPPTNTTQPLTPKPRGNQRAPANA